jgi:LPXTG-motif cell wall-anchored protein
MHTTPARRRIAGATMALGAILLGMSLFAPSANAGEDAPAFFNPADYDTTLHGPHRGTSADASGFSGTCPTDESVAGLTAWHLILTDNGGHDYESLDVRVTIDGLGVTLTGLTPKAKDDWAGFDPTKNFMADPTLKHAYVYAGDGDDVLVDAAAQVTPDGAADKIVLSHICPGEGTTDDGGDDGGDTTTGEVQATTGGEQPETEVLGNVVEPQALPVTGDNDASLAIVGAALVLVGGGILLIRRNMVPGS